MSHNVRPTSIYSVLSIGQGCPLSLQGAKLKPNGWPWAKRKCLFCCWGANPCCCKLTWSGSVWWIMLANVIYSEIMLSLRLTSTFGTVLGLTMFLPYSILLICHGNCCSSKATVYSLSTFLERKACCIMCFIWGCSLCQACIRIHGTALFFVQLVHEFVFFALSWWVIQPFFWIMKQIERTGLGVTVYL